MTKLKVVLGLFLGSSIESENETIHCKAYASQESKYLNKYGFFLLKYNNELKWWIIIDYVSFS